LDQLQNYRLSSTMYVVYEYLDYRKDNCVQMYAAFDDLDAALEYASDLGDGKDTRPEYACHRGAYFDQHAKEGCYERIAVDSVSVS
ncbi:112_t:CDS:1, partial [Ambispora leptoticha]